MGWAFYVFHDDSSHELGVNLNHRIVFYFSLIFIVAVSAIFGKNSKVIPKSPSLKSSTYKYWNASRRILDLKGEPQTFYGQTYYVVTFNKDGRIKTVTRIDETKEPQETYHLIWNKSGTQSEYKIEFLTFGNASRLDAYLYSNKLSHVRPGWIADFKSRKDGRPKEVSFSDKLGFTYFSYMFNYSYDKSVEMEVIESSYFDSKGEFVGRHLLFWEGDAWLNMIQYYDENNQIIDTHEFIHDFSKEETIRIISDATGREIIRKIIPFMQPDKYAYRLEWNGREIVDHVLLDVGTVAIAREFYKKTERALKEANQKVAEAKKKLEETKLRANEAEKILLRAKQNAQDIKQFKFEMDDAKKQATIAIESMLVAEKEANDARLLVAAAVAAEKVKKATEIEQYAEKEAKSSHKDAKKAEKEAKKKEKEAAKLMKKAIRDSSDLGDKSFITFSNTTPFLIEQALQYHTAKTGYMIGLGRRDLFTIRDMDVNLGLEINWYDFESDTTEENFQTLSYYLIAQLDPKFSWYWLPKNMEMGFKMGAGLISPGYGFTAGYSAVFNLSPTPLAIGIVAQFNWVANITSNIPSSYWSSVGLVFGLNFEDKLPSLF